VSRQAATKVLLIEDNSSDAVLIADNILLDGNGGFAIKTAGTLKEGILLSGGYDVVLLDMWLPDSSGIETLLKFRESAAAVPVIIITGLDNTEVSIKAIQSGAQDYIVKDSLTGKMVIRAIMYAIERKAITDSLEGARMDLERVIDGAPIMMFVAGRDMQIKKCNETASEFTGVSRADALGKRLGGILRCENCAADGLTCIESDVCRKCPFYLYLNDAAASGESFSRIEVKKNIYINGAPVEYYFLMSMVPLKYNSEDCFLISLEDITMNKKSAEKKSEAINKMRELDMLKSNFVAMISHELRSPMTAIKGFLEIVISGVGGSVSAQQTEYLEIIRSNTDRLMNLINDILDMAKMESGTFPVVKSVCNIEKLLKKIIKETVGLASKKMIIVEKEGVEGDMTAEIDEFRIAQVMVNLISNAIKYSPEKSKILIGSKIIDADAIPGSLPVSDSAGNSRYVMIYVKDLGDGIEKVHLGRIFDRFYQVNQKDNQVLKGVGLGLNISKNIVEAHDGFIWAESEGKGTGSTFKFAIPLKEI
jgi:signal transduction histidine kinase/DNA-binding response OmpR family regulator